MSINSATKNHDVRSLALVLRRVNYGEADRILDLLTPTGTIAVIAKSVRKEKSKLAGGIELFCLSEITYHQGKSSGMATLTSAKMQKFYANIMTDLAKMEFAALVLKKIAHAAEGVEGSEFFNLTRDILEALNGNINQKLVETFFWLNFAHIRGESVNLNRDVNGTKLDPDQKYFWDSTELAFSPHEKGNYEANDIKYLRLMLSAPLALAAKVNYPVERLDLLLLIAKSMSQL